MTKIAAKISDGRCKKVLEKYGDVPMSQVTSHACVRLVSCMTQQNLHGMHQEQVLAPVMDATMNADVDEMENAVAEMLDIIRSLKQGNHKHY